MSPKMLRSVIVGLTGFFLIGIGIGSLFTVPPLIKQHIQEKLTLQEGSQAFKLWEKVPFPIFNKFYFFNVTNPQAIEREGAKPILKEIGPFTYKVSLSKFKVKDNHNGTLSFRERKSWHFERSLSVADESQLITTLNTPLALTLTLIQGASSTVRVLITLALDAVTEGFFIKRTVKQLLFAGYPDLLSTFGPLLNPEIPSNNNGRFGFMYPKNNTDDGEYTIFSGVESIDRLNMINHFNGRPSLNFWASKECNSLHGSTNGQMVPPFKDGKTPTFLKIFSSDLCRTLRLKYALNYQPYPGLSVYRYSMDPRNFASSRDYPPNKCYVSKLPEPQPSLLYALTRPQTTATPPPPLPSSVPLQFVSPLAPSSSSTPIGSSSSPRNPNPTFGPSSSPLTRQSQQAPTSSSPPYQTQRTRRRSPYPSGVFDLSACKYGAPLVISQPHFLNSDPIYRKAVVGMVPNQSAHSFWVDIEPMTGSTVNLAARLQLNVAIHKAPGLFRYRNIPEVVFPIFWQEYHFTFDSGLAQMLVDAKGMPYLVSSISFYSFLSIGLAMAIAGFLLYVIPYLRTHSIEINGKQIHANMNGQRADDKEILGRKASSNLSEDGIDNPSPVSTA